MGPLDAWLHTGPVCLSRPVFHYYQATNGPQQLGRNSLLKDNPDMKNWTPEIYAVDLII